MFVLFIRNLLYNLMAFPSSEEADALDSLDISEHHSEMEMDEQSEETTNSVQQGVQLISKKKHQITHMEVLRFHSRWKQETHEL